MTAHSNPSKTEVLTTEVGGLWGEVQTLGELLVNGSATIDEKTGALTCGSLVLENGEYFVEVSPDGSVEVVGL